MKNEVLSLALLVLSAKALAGGPFDASQDLPFSCPGQTILANGYTVECRDVKGFKATKEAKVDGNVRSPGELGIKTEVSGAIDLGLLPDADTSSAYAYYRKLVSRTDGKIAGVLSTELWLNDEMGVQYKFKARYTTEGKIATITVD